MDAVRAEEIEAQKKLNSGQSLVQGALGKRQLSLCIQKQTSEAYIEATVMKREGLEDRLSPEEHLLLLQGT